MRAVMLYLAVGLGCGGSKTDDVAEPCEHVKTARAELAALVGSAQGFASQAWSATDEATVRTWCDRMTGTLYRIHGYVHGFNARAYVSSARARTRWIDAQLTQASGAIDFDMEHGQCLQPEGSTTTTSHPTDGSPSTSTTRANRVVLTEKLATAKKQFEASLAGCPSE